MSERFVTRGFIGRRDQGSGASSDERRRRKPPGQYLTDDFPVLSAGPTPRTPLDRWSLTIEGLVYLFVHATPRDPLEEFAPAAVDFWERALDGVDADVVCVGHTHQPFILEVGDKLVVNPGSVGQPRDGDPRGGYAVIENHEVELKRFDYPVETAVQAVVASPLPDRAKELLVQVYRTGTSKNNKNGAKPPGNSANQDE